MDDETKIRAVSQWPLYPRLPLKRPSITQSWPEFAFIMPLHRHRIEDGHRKFYVGPYRLYPGSVYDVADDAESKDYADAAAIVADGWIVD